MRQHLRRPQTPVSFDWFNGRSCSLAIRIEMFENLSSHEEQQSSRPHVPTPVITFVSSRAPIRRNSIRVPKCAANAALSSLRSGRSLLEKKKTRLDPSNCQSAPRIFTRRSEEHTSELQ